MKIFKDQAEKLLIQGSVVAIPTDTIYGLAASYVQKSAIDEIYELKKRPTSNPLVLFIADTSDLFSFVESIPEGGKALIEAFWPGPLTLVLPSKNPGTTIAIRIPNHPLILSLLKTTGPLFVTSANISGSPPLISLKEIETTFGLNFPVLEGELPKTQTPSTILSFKENQWEIDRLGSITKEDLFPYILKI